MKTMSIANSEYSTKSARSSVYQTNGRPLSKEALYKAKMKYGIYQSPSAKTVGVPNSESASDTAALLAASTDLKVEPYKRSIANDAHTAALFAKKDTAPKAWTRDSVNAEASTAAAAVGKFLIKGERESLYNESIYGEVASSVEAQSKVAISEGSSAASAVLTRSRSKNPNADGGDEQSTYDGASAASAVLGRTGKTIGSLASSNLASLYEFDAVRSGKKRVIGNINLSKVTKASQERANTMISERMNPEWDCSRSGIKVEPKLDDASLEAFAAAGALASQGYEAPVDKDLEARAIFKNSMVSPKVLALASLNASNTLKGLEKQLDDNNLFSNTDFNRIAFEIASRHHATRTVNTGKINLGGGLYMTQAELDAIATKFVNPVLVQIDKTAESQRARDAEAARVKEEQRLAHEKYKADIRAQKAEDKRLKAEAKAQRRKELEDEKQRAREAKLALEKEKTAELEKQKEILEYKQQEEVRKREELLAKKQAEEERLAKESAEAEAKRKEELTAAERERDERLAPILANLKIEQDKLDVLNEEKQAVQEITDSHIKNTENSQNLLDVSKVELTHARERLETLKGEIETTTGEQEKFAKEAEIKAAEAEVALKESAEIEAEAALKKAEIDKQKALVDNERLKIQLELENEKIAALNEEKEIAETLPPSEKAKAEDAAREKAKAESEAAKAAEESTTKVTTSTGPTVVANPNYRSMVDEALNYVPKKQVEAKSSTTDGGELKQTFSGFSQGSDEKKELTTEEKHKSLFKEEF